MRAALFIAEIKRRAVIAVSAARADGSVYVIALMMVPGLAALAVKAAQMQLTSGFLTIARFTGRSNVADLSLLEMISFMRNDAVIQLVLMPVVVAILLRRWSLRVRLRITAFLAICICLILYFEIQALGTVGRFLTWAMATDAMRWALDNPSVVSEYFSLRGAAKLLLVILLIGIAGCLGASRNMSTLTGRLARTLEPAVLFFIAVAAFVATLSYFVPLPSFPHHRSVAISIVDALTEDRASALISDDASRARLVELYARESRTETRSKSDFPKGQEAGHDVLLFVMETGPRITWRSDALPGARTLVNRSFVSNEHYTTYPYTSDAIFSIVTGLYPLGRRSFLREGHSLRNAGLMAPLASRGYTGSVYLPWPDTFEDDTRMYAVAGFSERYTPSLSEQLRHKRARAGADATVSSLRGLFTRANGAQLRNRLTLDLMALDKLKEDLIENKRSGRRFVAMFMPQIGHAPWFDLSARDSIVERGRHIAGLQDGWLLELVELLERNGWLDDTVIVVTSDHGIRTRAEDPDLEAGTISDYTYNVPLLIFAPGTLQSARQLSERTSHVDLVPTLHALLGIPTPADHVSQGIEVWDDSRLRRRRVFMFGGEYLGADGFCASEGCVMLQSLTGAVYSSLDFKFDANELVTTTSAHAARAPIDTMYALQPRLLLSLQNGEVHGSLYVDPAQNIKQAIKQAPSGIAKHFCGPIPRVHIRRLRDCP